MYMLQIAADNVHLITIFGLLLRILITKNCSGISGKTQLLYGVIFVTRYIDLFTSFISWYNVTLKALFIGISYLTIILIHFVYNKSYQLENDRFYVEALLISAGPLAIFFNYNANIIEVLWTYSRYLEAVAILPQLYMIRYAGVNRTVNLYIFGLATYRGLYILKWIDCWYMEGYYDLVSTCSGVVQFCLYFTYFIFVRNQVYERLEQDEHESKSLISSAIGKLLKKHDKVITVSVLDVPMQNNVFHKSIVQKV